MASFSSVVRKGPKVLPKAAPRRNIVRKPQGGPLDLSADVDREIATDTPSPSTARAFEDANPPSTSNDQANKTSRSITRPQSTEIPHEPVVDESSRVTSRSLESDSTPRALEGTPTTIQEPSANVNVVPQLIGKSRSIPSVGREEAPTENHGRGERNSRHVADHIEEGDETSVQPEPTVRHHDASNSAHVPTLDPLNTTKSPAPQTQFRQTRKRKQPPRASANIILSQPSISATPVPPTPQSISSSRSPEIERAASRPPSVTSQQSDSQRSTHQDAFEQVNLRFQNFRNEVAAIPVPTPSPHPESRAVTATPAPASTDEDAIDPTSSVRPRKKRKTNRSKPVSVEEQVADIIENALGNSEESMGVNKRRNRGTTPEDAEEHEIAPETTKMGELCHDSKWGKKSETEKEMAANWEEIVRRRKEDAEQRIAAAASGSRRKRDKDRTAQMEAESNSGAAAVPDLVIENGQIVAASREVDRQGYLNGVVQDTDPSDIREDKDIFKRVLATTVGCRNPIAPGQTWDDLSTELFYTGLKKFGTDFQMISAMIPGKSRKQVKLKYNVEERKNWPRVKRCLGMKEEVNLEEYAEATGVQFASVADVYKQMEEDEKRLREEDEQRRRDEGIISQDQDAAADGADGDDVVLPSIEGSADVAAQDGVANSTAVVAERQSTASRVGSTTTARQTAQPSGKKKQPNKKNNANSKKTRQAAAKNKGFEGVEERIGGIEEVAMPVD